MLHLAHNLTDKHVFSAALQAEPTGHNSWSLCLWANARGLKDQSRGTGFSPPDSGNKKRISNGLVEIYAYVPGWKTWPATSNLGSFVISCKMRAGDPVGFRILVLLRAACHPINNLYWWGSKSETKDDSRFD